jgi:hypothetical protein
MHTLVCVYIFDNPSRRQDALPLGHAGLAVLVAVGDGVVRTTVESDVCNCSV